MPLRVAVVGANWGLNHVDAWKRVPGVELVAVCTAHQHTAEAVAAQKGIPRAYWDAAEMLAREPLDIVDVTTRPTVRAPIIMAALEERKHVLQPLPFALHLEQAAELLRLGSAPGVVADIENLHRHSPAFVQAKDMIDSGFLGEIYGIEAGVRTGILLDIGRPYVYEWITQPNDSASAIRNFGAHLMHTLLWLFGDVVEVTATNATMLRDLIYRDGSTTPNHTVDTAHALVRFSAGYTGSLSTSWVTPAGAGFGIDVHGSKGHLVVRADALGPQNARLQSATRLDKELVDVPIEARYHDLAGTLQASPDAWRDYALAAMCYRFAEAVRSGDRSRSGPSFAEAYRVMQIIEAANESSDRRAWVAV
jgi:predicted dehydrogenase